VGIVPNEQMPEPRQPTSDAADRKPLSTLQWIGVALLVALAVVGCITAGRWQFSRYEHREEAINTVKANYESVPVPLEELLSSPDAELDPSQPWTRVEATGRYAPQYTALLRNRPINSTPSVHVLVPFVTNSGHTLLVNRGWSAQDTDFERPSVLPDPPAGEVTIVVHLRPSEPKPTRGAPVGQVQMIHVPDAFAAGLEWGSGTAGDLPGQYENVYGSLDSESPAATDYINPPPRPSTDPKNHLSYALQWWVFAIGAVAGFGVLIIRETRSRRAPNAQTNPFAELNRLERSSGEGSSATSRRRRQEPTEEDYEDSLFE
jgi:cytochrome oxidase assembly protein ShyY1